MIVDAHVRLGPGREVSLDADTLLRTMDMLGIDRAVVAPGERATAYDNRAGNDLVTSAVAASGGRLSAYAVANPWRADAVDELARARDAGAAALAIDPAIQGFDLHDGLVDPLIDFAASAGWLVYVRTGTPPAALPLPLAELALRHPGVSFLMGRSGATDFWIDAAPALHRAPNLYADTCYAPWDTVLTDFAKDPEIGTARVVFTTDAPYTIPSVELARVVDWDIDDADRADVLGLTITGLLGD